MRPYAAEFLGTFWLVLGGCGSAVLAGAFPNLGIGFHGVALAFGLTVLTMAYAVGHISGGHFNRGLRISSSLIVGGTSTALVLLVGFLALHEPVTPMRLFALGLIACGILLLQIQGG